MKTKHADVRNQDKSNTVPEAPDGGWGWIIVLSSFMCNVLVDGIGLAYGVLLPRLVDHFQAARSKVSLVGSLLLGTYFSTGIGFGMIYLPSIVVVGLYYNKKRTKASGIAVCGSGIGSFTLASVLEFLSEEYHWRGVLLIIAGFILNGAVFGRLMRLLISQKHLTKTKVKEECKAFPKFNGTSNGKTCNVDDTTEIKPFLHYEECTYNDKNSNILKPLHTKSLFNISNRARTTHECHSLEHRDDKNTTMVFDNRQYCSLPELKYPNTEESSKASLDQQRSTLSIKNLIVLEIFYFSLLLNLSFVLIFIGNFFNTAAKYIPYMYLVDRVILLGVSSSDAALLLSIIGVTNTIGRFLSAMIANIKGVNALVVLIFDLLLAAVTVFLQPICRDYPSQVVFSVMYGLSVGGSSTALTSLVLCDLLGDKLPKPFGQFRFARGIACVVGPWFSGDFIHKNGKKQQIMSVFYMLFKVFGLLFWTYNPLNIKGPFIGRLVNTFGCRKIAIIGSIATHFGVIITSLSPDLVILIITYRLIGGKS